MSKALVYKATSDDSSEPGGFVLKELAQQTLIDANECSTILSLLIKRLNKDKADVKFKTLRVIKYLCVHGRTEFRLELQRSNNDIRACMSYRGIPDPLRGDAPYQRVRDEAKEAMNAIFNSSSSSQSTPHVAGRIQGYGVDEPAYSPTSSPYNPSIPPSSNDYGYPGTYSTPQLADNTSKYGGYGSGGYQPNKDRAGFLDKVKSKIAGDTPPPPFKPYSHAAPYSNEFSSSTSSTPSYTSSSSSSSIPDSTTSVSRQKGQVGGVWATAPTPANETPFHSNTNRGTFGAQPTTTTNTTRRPASSNGEYESRIIDSICTPSGVRSTPTKEELTKFTQQASSLDNTLLASLLIAKLAAGQAWQSQMKALCCLEALLAPGSEEVEDYVCENAENIIALEQNSSNAQLKQKVTRVLELAGLREPAAAPTAAPTTSTSSYPQVYQQQKQVDLLNLNADSSANVLPQSSSTNSKPSSTSLLDSLNSNATAVGTGSSSSSSGFDFLGDSHNNATNNNSSTNSIDQVGSLFGNLEIKNTSHGNGVNTSSADPLEMFANAALSTHPPAAQSSKAPTNANGSNGSSASSDPFAALESGTSLNKVDPVTFLLATSKPSTPAHLQQGAAMPIGMGMAGPGGARPPLGAGAAGPYGMMMPPPHAGSAYNNPLAPHLHSPLHPSHPHNPHHPYHPQAYHHPSGYPQFQPSYPGGPGAPLTQSGPSALNFTVRSAGASGVDSRPPLMMMPQDSSGAGAGGGAFGFVNETKQDSFGFVTDMMKS